MSVCFVRNTEEQQQKQQQIFARFSPPVGPPWFLSCVVPGTRPEPVITRGVPSCSVLWELAELSEELGRFQDRELCSLAGS